MTKTEIQNFLLNKIVEGTDPSITTFNSIARVALSYEWSKQKVERSGEGMPRFNAAIKELIETGRIVRSVKGNNTYYKVA